MEIGGTTAPGFEAVRDAFARGFAERGELGAAAFVFHHGEPVVNLWGGWTDAARTRPWRADTIVQAYSTVKPMIAACALVLVDRGALQLDGTVSTWWPEFGRAGKERITVRELLSHQAGLIALRDDVPRDELFDWDAIIARLEAEAPWWEPGTAHGEHAGFYGHLVGELVRRVDGRPIRRFFDEELARPWRMDYQIGVCTADRGRVAPLAGLDVLYPDGEAGEPGSVYRRALTNPPGMLDPTVVNGDAWMDADVPAVNGFGTAEAVARFHQGFLAGGVLDGHRLLSAELCGEALRVQSSGRDRFLDEDVSWGLGFQLDAGTFGHGGLGGSFGYASPSLALSCAYVTNLMATHERGDAVADAAEACAARIG